tara:strand:+ start:2278 stop:4653 length:2376 start_codon:yes stop_codon:yes gene_type:complete
MADAKLKFIGGINHQPYEVGADNIENMRYDSQRLCWSNDRSYASWYAPDSEGTVTGEPATEPVYSIYSYQRHKSSLHSMLFEELDATNNNLDLKVINGPVTTTLNSDRVLPSGNDPGTQYCRIGKFLFVVNGEDRPLIYRGGRAARTAFFHDRPAPLYAHPAPGLMDNQWGSQTRGTLEKRQRMGSSGINIFDSAGNLGMAPSPEYIRDVASTTLSEYAVQTDNCYEYAVSYVLDTAAESQVSDYSNQVVWSIGPGQIKNAAHIQYKFGVSLRDIPRGPEGTVKRRIYRTKNQRNGFTGAGRILYFLAEIPDNVTTVYLDLIPDSGLGAVAPSVTESAAFPTGISLLAAFKNHLIAAGSPENPSVLYYSRGNIPEQFPAFNFFDIGDRDGGAVTALYTASNVCYVFRERSIDALVATDNIELPFKIVPVVSGVGTLSPNSICEVPSIGVVFCGSDKQIYALKTGGDTSYYEGQTGLVQLSQPIHDLCEEISASSLGRVNGAYSTRDQEYWVTAPVNGDRYTTKGFVFHAKPKVWSTRTNVPAACFTEIPERWIAFGSNATLTNLPVIDGVDESDANDGIMVWCGAKGEGYVASDDPQGTRHLEETANSYVYETTWLDFNDPDIIKHLLSVTLFVYKNVAGGGEMSVGMDWKPINYSELSEENSIKTSFSTYNSEQSPAGLYESAGTTFGGDFKTTDVRTIDNNRYSTKEITQVSVSNPYGSHQIVDGPPINTSKEQGAGGNRWYKLKFEGNKPFALIGFSLNYETSAGIKQLSFAAGKPDSDTLIRSVMGL